MKSVAFAALLSLATASLVAQDTVKTRYYLPKTTLTVTGTVTTKNEFVENQGQVSTKPTSETSQIGINLAVMPDPSNPYDLVTESALLAKTTTTIDLASTGLLAGVNTKSEGQLGTIVRNIFSAAVSLATMAAGRSAAGLLNAKESPAEKLYAVEAQDAAQRRSALKAAVNKATSELVAEETKLIGATTAEGRKSARERLDQLQVSVKELRAELSLADAAFGAWKSRKEDATEKPLNLMFDVDLLPADQAVRSLAEAAGNPAQAAVEDAAGVFKPTLEKVRLIVTQDRAPLTAPAIPAPGHVVAATERITYRQVRPAIISIYAVNADYKPILVKRTVEIVVDRSAPALEFPVFSSKWTTKSIGVTFTGAVPTKVTTEIGSSAAAVSDTVKNLPADYLASLKAGNEITSEQAKVQANAIQSRIDQLKQQKALNEQKVATGESLDMANLKQQSDRIDAEIALLDKQRAQAAAQTTGADLAAMTTQKQILDLQNSLLDAQKKQLELQQALDDLRKKISGGGGL
jgi:hypothetical protein